MEETSASVIRNAAENSNSTSQKSTLFTRLRERVVREPHALEWPSRIQIAIWGVLLLVTLAVSLSNYEAYQVGTHFDDAVAMRLVQAQ